MNRGPGWWDAFSGYVGVGGAVVIGTTGWGDYDGFGFGLRRGKVMILLEDATLKVYSNDVTANANTRRSKLERTGIPTPSGSKSPPPIAKAEQ